MTQFLKDRRRLLTAAVMKDDWESAKAYCKKYGVPIPDDERVMENNRRADASTVFVAEGRLGNATRVI